MLGWDQLLFQINQILLSDIASEVATEFANNIPLPSFFNECTVPPPVTMVVRDGRGEQEAENYENSFLQIIH